MIFSRFSRTLPKTRRFFAARPVRGFKFPNFRRQPGEFVASAARCDNTILILMCTPRVLCSAIIVRPVTSGPPKTCRRLHRPRTISPRSEGAWLFFMVVSPRICIINVCVCVYTRSHNPYIRTYTFIRMRIKPYPLCNGDGIKGNSRIYLRTVEVSIISVYKCDP